MPMRGCDRRRPRAPPAAAPASTARTKSPLRATVAVASRNQSTGRKDAVGRAPDEELEDDRRRRAAGRSGRPSPRAPPSRLRALLRRRRRREQQHVRQAREVRRRRDADLEEELAAARHRLDAADRHAARIDAVDSGRLDEVAAGDRGGRRDVVQRSARPGRRRARRRARPCARCARPAAADASSSSCARDTPRPTVTTRPTSPAGTASGEPGATPSAEPAPISTPCTPARCSTSRIGHAADDARQGRALPRAAGAPRRPGAPRRAAGRARARARRDPGAAARSLRAREKSASVEPTAVGDRRARAPPTAAATGAEAERIQDWSTVPPPPRPGACAERTSTHATSTVTSTAPPRRGLTAAISALGLRGSHDGRGREPVRR